MNSSHTRTAILALAALAAGSGAFAEGRDPYATPIASSAGAIGKTRAEVQAELVQAQRAGFNSQLGHTWNGDSVAGNGQRVRADVRREAAGGGIPTSALERDYPLVR